MFNPKEDCIKHNKCGNCRWQVDCPIIHNPKNIFTLRKIKEQRNCFNCFDNEKCTLEQPCCKGSKPSMFD